MIFRSLQKSFSRSVSDLAAAILNAADRQVGHGYPQMESSILVLPRTLQLLHKEDLALTSP